MKHYLCLWCLLLSIPALSQVTEFKKEWVTHIRWHNGLVSNFHEQPDLYVGGLQAALQYGVLPGSIRVGGVAGGFYTGKKWQVLAGPTSSFLLKSFKAGEMGTAGNLHASLEYLWGSQYQQLFGGGLHADILNKLTIGFTAHRDYGNHQWWLQSVFSFRISKLQKVKREY